MATQTHPFAVQHLLLYGREILLFATLDNNHNGIDDTGCQQQTGEHEPYPSVAAFGHGRMRAYILLKSLIRIRHPYALSAVFDLFVTAPNGPESADFIGITVDRIEAIS